MSASRMALAVIASALAIDAHAGWIDDAGIELRFDDNLTRAQLEHDIMSDAALLVSGSGGSAMQLSENGRLLLTLALSGSAYRRYHGLDHLGAGLALAYRWKSGLGPYAPELRLSGASTRLDYRDAGRDSWLYLAEIGLAKRLSQRLGMRVAYQVEQRKSDTVGSRVVPRIAANVFDLKSRNLNASADYSPHPHYVLSAAFTLRDGDIVSTTLRNFPIFRASSAIALDPVFGPNRYAYTMQARTRGLSLGVSRVLGSHASFTLGYEYVDSRVDGGIDYSGNLVRASYLYQF
jgi:hypothetical protein